MVEHVRQIRAMGCLSILMLLCQLLCLIVEAEVFTFTSFFSYTFHCSGRIHGSTTQIVFITCYTSVSSALITPPSLYKHSSQPRSQFNCLPGFAGTHFSVRIVKSHTYTLAMVPSAL